MRHNMGNRKLGRTTSHRLAMFRNQIASLVISERIITTLPKAKELRPIAEKVITQGKRGTVHARRLAARWVSDRDILKKLFSEIAPRFANRTGGYLRIVKLGPRPGDGAEMAILEFVDFELKVKAVPTEEEKKAKGKKVAPEEGAEAESTEKQAAPKKKGAAKAPKAKTEPKPKSDGKSRAKPSSQQKPKGGTRSGGGRKSGGE
ncbi:MAG: 50S ribosomal protein L17 [Acidobacteriota bacterium]